jgi:hypothetical protein
MQSGCGQIAGVGRGQRADEVVWVIVGQIVPKAEEKGRRRRRLWVVSAV